MAGNDEHATELTPRIGRPATAALTLAGLHDVREPHSGQREGAPALHGVGTKAIRILEEELAARGLAFRR